MECGFLIVVGRIDTGLKFYAGDDGLPFKTHDDAWNKATYLDAVGDIVGEWSVIAIRSTSDLSAKGENG